MPYMFLKLNMFLSHHPRVLFFPPSPYLALLLYIQTPLGHTDLLMELSGMFPLQGLFTRCCLSYLEDSSRYSLAASPHNLRAFALVESSHQHLIWLLSLKWTLPILAPTGSPYLPFCFIFLQNTHHYLTDNIFYLFISFIIHLFPLKCKPDEGRNVFSLLYIPWIQ